MATAEKPFSKFTATTDIFPSVTVHTYVTCDNFANAATSLPQHDKVQKTDLKPLQLVKSEWSPPLQQLPVSSVNTKCLRIDSTKYSCVQFDVQFPTSAVNKLHCTFAWICVDFSWKTAFISYHVMSAKTRVLKCCCLLFDWTEFWESSALLNRDSWLAYGDFREKTWLDHGTKTTFFT